MKWAVLILLVLLAYGHFNKKYFNRIDLEVSHFAYSALVNDALMREVNRDMDLAETRLAGMIRTTDTNLLSKQWAVGIKHLLEVDSALLKVQEDIREWDGVLEGYAHLQQQSKANLGKAQQLHQLSMNKEWKAARDFWEDDFLPHMLRFEIAQLSFAHNVQHQAVLQVLDSKTRVEKASYMGKWVSIAIVILLIMGGIYFVIQIYTSLRKMREIV